MTTQMFRDQAETAAKSTKADSAESFQSEAAPAAVISMWDTELPHINFLSLHIAIVGYSWSVARLIMNTRQYTPGEDRNLLGQKSNLFTATVRPSRSSSREGSSESTVSGVENVRDTVARLKDSTGDEKQQSQTRTWIPYTFKPPFLASLSFVSFGICLVSFLLWWRSSTNYGLGSDDGSSAMLFGWRYSPTLIAVIYVQMTSVLFEDVKRTEPYARLARPKGAEASASILKAPGAWWNALYDGFAKKRNGSRSIVLICASFLNIIGFMAISPLSSAFLFSEDVVVPKSTAFTSLVPTKDSPLSLDSDRATHFRTIANLLQNVSTSPWITDEYTILPFWPTDMQNVPIKSLPTSPSQKWEAETVMFKSQFNCTQMKLDRQTSVSPKYGLLGKLPSISTIWSSSDGCKYGLTVETSFFEDGGGSWSDTSTFYNGLAPLGQGMTSVFFTNSTAECDNRDIIILTEPWKSEGAKYSAQLCDSSYYMANVTTTITLGGDEPEISYDESEFDQKKVTIPETLLSTTLFRNLTLDEDWPTYMVSIFFSGDRLLGGPSILLGALYDYNITSIVNDPNWVLSAAKAKQRYFGEVLQAALTHQGASDYTPMNGYVHDIEPRVVVQAGPAIALGVLLAISFILVLAIWWFSREHVRPLHLTDDPASTLGTARLITHASWAESGFRSFRQPSDKELHEKLAGEWFFTTPQGLSRVNTDDLMGNESSQSENGTPALFRLPALLSLSLVLVVVVIGVSVLYHFAQTSGLYEKAFVYQVQISFINNGLSSVAPFAMIPTVIATGIGLWWSAMDDNFRRLQPFIAMSKGSPSVSRGAGLSYRSSFWLWACAKAALNKHWLLAFLTLGSSLSPVFTTTMSALFDRGPGVVSQPVTLNRTLELRQIPLVFPASQSLYPGSSNDYTAGIIADLYSNLSTHWMYTATIQLTLNGTQPAWSKDGWSFVPALMNNLHNVDLPNDLDKSDSTVDGARSNVSFTTQAMRGRIECSEPPLKAMLNISNWLTYREFKNSSTANWDKSSIPHGLEGGFQLGKRWGNDYLASTITPFVYPHNMTDCIGCTTAFANPSEITCCGNSSSDAWDPTVAIGFWSPNVDPDVWSTRHWQQNFTAKFFHGNAVTGVRTTNASNDIYVRADDVLFTSPPSASFLTCRPLVESANAHISVNPDNGEIQSFNITDEPKEMSSGFSDNFLPHNKTHWSKESGKMTYNVTVSHGRLFMASMLTAADTINIAGALHGLGYTLEDLDDNTYNIRDEINGLNMDFMTYAMYSMAGKDPKKLLDSDTFNELAQKTFSTFFQHFVSNEVSMETGGWGYQKINDSLPSELGPALELVDNYLPGNKASAQQDVIQPISHTNRTVEAHLTRRVELLQMNAVAVWLSISIMAWLILTTVVVAILQKRYFGSLVRNVECLGDVLVLIAGSANLLQVVREIQAGTLLLEDYKHLRTRLGWFVDEDGELRWGIEMEESYGDGPGVHWVSAPYFSKGKGSQTWNLADEGEVRDQNI
ncbi:hypothetical protein N7532_004361 [Penicillium argentinense]|uniref:Uncharacterized protein n=1 Tax=Penicillium argentinense TaxID=1131581 RepID=A0A9W9KG26_9EURO|nr:uncharacterized protein N7532_004361 [Penicillium argentinense]KAJ5103832.1 hypothetical protein N7532_004361 [Penicillium argentinense]